MSTSTNNLSLQAVKRLQGGEMILNGHDNDDIAEILGVSPSAVQKWRRKLNANNDHLHSLVRKKGSGRIATLNEKQKQRLKKIILKGAVAGGFPDERWTSKRVADVIRKIFNINLSISTTRRLLHSLGLSPQMPVVKSHNHSDEAVVEWASRTWPRIKKKAKRLGIPLILLDESGFSLSPIRGTTWAEVGKPIVLRETFSRQTQTGLGFITMTPKQQRLHFRFTIFSGAVNTEDMIFFLTEIHRHYHCRVMIIFDRLSAHVAAQKYFEGTHPDWFLFEYFPVYSPELNPVEQCWQQMKNVLMSNFVAKSREEVVAKALESAQVIDSDPKLLAAFFHHAKLAL